MPERFIKPILVVIAISMLAWILFWIIFSISKKKEGVKISFQAEITFFLFYIYTIGVLSLTIIPLPFERFEMPNENSINITPLVNTVRGVLEIFKYRSLDRYSFLQHIAQNIIGNIILFIPLGIFLPLISVKYRVIGRVIVFAAVCSLSIELTQLILRQFEIYRTVDIDDVILNTSGAILGFVIIKKLYFNKEEMY